MRIVMMSDTHGFHKDVKVPAGDLLIHAGDATETGTIKELNEFAEWFISQPHPMKVFVPGNHDIVCQRIAAAVLQHSIFSNRAEVLINDLRLIDTTPDLGVEQDVPAIDVTAGAIRLYGHSWMPKYGNYAFMLERGKDELKKAVSYIPDTVDILVSHCPPIGILDKNRDGIACGCETLGYHLNKISSPPFLHVFGHIHDSPGVFFRWEDQGGIMYVNASLCITKDGKNILVNQPTVVDFIVNTQLHTVEYQVVQDHNGNTNATSTNTNVCTKDQSGPSCECNPQCTKE